MRFHRSINRISRLLVIVVGLVGLLLIILELDEILLALERADLRAVPGILFFTLLSYASMSTAFLLVCHSFGLRTPNRELAEIGFVTNTINHLLSSGGLAGFSLRYVMMVRHGVSLNQVLGISAVHFYLTSLDMIVMFPVGVIYLDSRVELPRLVWIALVALALILIVIAAGIMVLSLVPALRFPVLSRLDRLIRRLTADRWQPSLLAFDRALSESVMTMRRNPARLAAIMLLTVIDWFASMMVLAFCLNAFGPPVPLAFALTGFVIGSVAGVASMIPGGIGVQEVSSTGILVLLGVPFGQAFLAAILFRTMFFFLPYLVSLFLYRHLLRVGGFPEGSTHIEV